MILITNDAQLRSYVPNALVTVTGEMSLFDKMRADLALSEQWLTIHFVDASLLGKIALEKEHSEAANICCRAVVADALLRAIPSLDLVLTPNGFGIVSNQNVAPASKDRVDRLLSNLELVRDRSLQQLLYLLPKAATSEWLQSEAGKYFAATLFPYLDLPSLLGYTDKLWERYQQYWAQLKLIEAELADKFISSELYARLRQRFIEDSCDIVELDLVNRLRAIELALLKGKQLDVPALHAIVTYIRKNPADFPEWAASETATHFSDQSFNNSKQSGGYWF